MGPRKPQRTAAFSNAAMEPAFQVESESSRLLYNFPSYSPKTNTPAHKLQLETSFTSLLSPNDKSTCKISLQSFCSHSSNNTNTVTTNSVIKNDSCTFKQIKPEVQASLTKALVPWEYQSVLDDQNSQHISAKNRDENANDKIDLLHDNWFGLAPLATPESLSEVSSISSRASSVIIHHDRQNNFLKDRWISGTSFKRRYSNGYKTVRESENERTLKNQLCLKSRNFENSDSSDSYLDSPPLNRPSMNLKSIPSIDSRKSSSGESSFLNYGINSPERDVQTQIVQKSPRLLRRTLKITKGLATAYEDSYSNKRFEEMMKIRFDRYENTSNETNSSTSAKSQDLEKSSTDLYLTPASSSGDSVRYRTPENFVDSVENFQDYGDVKKNEIRKSFVKNTSIQEKFRFCSAEEDINYHKPTTVIMPTDEKFPIIVSDRDATQYQYPYLETDFSLSDPDLTCRNNDEPKKSSRKIKFDETLESGVSFCTEDEFENTRLIDLKDSSEMSFRSTEGFHTQDFLCRNDGDDEDAAKAEECLVYKKNKTKSSQDLLSANICRENDSKSHFSSRSAEALPLLANITHEYTDQKRKYSFTFLTINKGESSV